MIEIIFENEHFVVCDKPAGVLSTPGRPHEDDHRLCLGTALQKKLNTQIFPVHRLDFEVSGLVLYAKNAKAHSISNSWFENKLVKKTYRALTTEQDYSHIPTAITNPRNALHLEVDQWFEWKSSLLRGKKRAYESPQGKPSLTRAHYLGNCPKNNFLQWDLLPVTGRSHQLRFELSRHGFPIVGDKLYGSLVEWQSQAIALRSYRLDFRNIASAGTLDIPPFIEIASI